MSVRPAHMRSPELARWLNQHGLAGCTCTWLPTGTANWYLYRVIDGCPCEHPDAPPPRPSAEESLPDERLTR